MNRVKSVIRCEFCAKTIGGSTVSGTFSNYISHCEAKHKAEWGGYEADAGLEGCIFGAHKPGECPADRARAAA